MSDWRKFCESQPDYALTNMVKALNSFPWMNTQDDKDRLEMAKVVLKERRARARKK